MSTPSREVRLVRRPDGAASVEDFAVAEVVVPDPGEGEVLVENLYLSVDPGQRGLMNGGESYVATYGLGQAVTGRTVGRVVKSRSSDVPEGTHVFHRVGWREHSIVPTAQLRTIDVDRAPVSAYLGVMGHPGLTSWLGMRKVAHVGEGDVVLVSSAAGAVGAAAGQIAVALGASRVIGSVGSAEKADYVLGLGFTEAFSYRETSVGSYLAASVPDGLGVLFDNVGGAQLDDGLAGMRLHGRLALCGSISTYNTGPYPLTNAGLILSQRLTAQGFLVYDYDHEDVWDEFRDDMSGWIASGAVTLEETVMDGVESLPEAFVSLFTGTSTGKVLVRTAAAS